MAYSDGQDHSLEPATATDLAQAERDLSQAVRTRYAHWGSVLQFPAPRPELAASQRAWVAYRDAWLRLLRALPDPVPETAVSTALTRERIAELKHHDEN